MDEPSSKVDALTKEDHLQDQVHVSKSQLKKQLKRQKYLERRPEKRRLEREKKRQRKLLKTAAQSQEAISTEDGHLEKTSSPDRPRLIRFMSESPNRFKVVIDMDFEDFMTDNELSKAVQQVGRIYAANRRSPGPCQLYVTSYRGKVREKFASVSTGCEKWDINFCPQNYEDIFLAPQDDQETSNMSLNRLNKIIYLSGDSDNILPDTEDLTKDDSQVFIIGGLVDHNRHKNLCQRRAEERSVKTARLPIKEYVQLNQRHILSTVTVFEILLRVLSLHQSWPEAFEAIPKRKLASEKQVLLKPSESN